MKTSILSLMLFLLSAISIAQGNSPFSQFGPGDFFESNFQTNFSRAGLGASITSGNNLNPINPASYSSLSLTTGETGIYSSTNFLSNESSNDIFNNTNLSSFALGFPILENVGISFGLSPYSKQNYSFTFNETLEDNSEVEYEYAGDGGLSKLFLGFGASKNGFSIGMNGQYYFGRLNDISKVKYTSSDYKNIRFQNFNNVKGLSINSGLQYNQEFNTQNYFNLGATYELGNTLSSTNYILANYFAVNSATTTNNEIIEAEFHETSNFPVDTRESPEEGTITLPSSLQTGFSVGKYDKWEASLEYKNRDLSSFKLNGNSTALKNSNTFIVGASIVPNKKALGLSNYWKTISYNFGIKAGNTGYSFNGEELSEFGINFGLGMPLKKFKYQTENFGSSVFLSFGYLNRSNSNLGLNENYLNINASVILNDKWFIKRKFK